MNDALIEAQRAADLAANKLIIAAHKAGPVDELVMLHLIAVAELLRQKIDMVIDARAAK